MLAVENLYAGMMEDAGLRNIAIHKIRKRNSKKELYEFVVTGTNGTRRTRSFVFESSPRKSAQQAALGF